MKVLKLYLQPQSEMSGMLPEGMLAASGDPETGIPGFPSDYFDPDEQQW